MARISVDSWRSVALGAGRTAGGWLVLALSMLVLLGCDTPEQKAARQQERYTAAKNLFDQTVKTYHLPSAEATGEARARLLTQAAEGYARLLRDYPDQPVWCAPALRSLGNIRATQGRLDEAVQLYARVGKDCARQDWEVLQAWKSAADLLRGAGRQEEAQKYYAQIVARFDQPDAPPVVRTVVRAAKLRVNSGAGEDRDPALPAP